ncbi:phosphatase inhibitor-domain-containing protein [Tribonema minus]|uniref:Phosphatase inhibitor-domain-containing protein n=1 Tax=Tribonema minus TaxID=303371 RepID=A0A835Z1Q2_9STRA|nr:phosphatase inhibitor-domain-containing protein [Tribonema minus]
MEAKAVARSAAMTETLQAPAEAKATTTTLTLRLQARKAVQWDEEVVDNENAGRKSSKRCCIFHKQRKFGESDSEESSSDLDDEEREKYWSEPKPGRPNRGQVYHA